MAKKYSVSVSNYVNCSSDSRYHGSVSIRSKDGFDGRDIDLESMGLWVHVGVGYTKKYPKYVKQEIVKQFKEKLDNQELIIYEYNRDSERRYENLRYHDNDLLKSEIDYHYWKMKK